MTYRGRIENGHVVFKDSVSLPDGTEVTISLVEPPPLSDNQDAPTLYETLKDLVGSAHGLPPDASTNVDHYLYGHPKK